MFYMVQHVEPARRVEIHHFIFPTCNTEYGRHPGVDCNAFIAQLDRTFVYEAKGYGFKSWWKRKPFKPTVLGVVISGEESLPSRLEYGYGVTSLT